MYGIGFFISRFLCILECFSLQKISFLKTIVPIFKKRLTMEKSYFHCVPEHSPSLFFFILPTAFKKMCGEKFETNKP